MPTLTTEAQPPPERPQFVCRRCGAGLAWDPGATELACPHCGELSRVAAAAAPIPELDYETHLALLAQHGDTRETLTTRCGGCGAEVSFAPDLVSDLCPFCGAAPVRAVETRRLIKPQAVLPFRITAGQARAAFRRWVQGLWFAPTALRRLARGEAALQGIYLPHWTYDAATRSHYLGERGEHYYVTVQHTSTENGRTVQRTRQEQRTRWYPASGVVHNRFDDLLVPASTALPSELCRALEPWDLRELVQYDDAYLSGFRTLGYTLDLPGGFAVAAGIMDAHIQASIRRDIGGDEQRIHQVSTRYAHVTFKHLLLPVWLSAYRYRERVYRFLVNARTGEVQGERPWSWPKLALAVVLAILLAFLIALLADRASGAAG